jgi:hypothetical protein
MQNEQMMAWALFSMLGTAVIFYSLGVAAGRKDGHKAGRAVGIRIGERRAREAVSK